MDVVEAAYWMMALDKLEDKKLSERGIHTPESDFYATWWNCIYDATGGKAWEVVQRMQDGLIG